MSVAFESKKKLNIFKKKNISFYSLYQPLVIKHVNNNLQIAVSQQWNLLTINDRGIQTKFLTFEA